MNAIDFPTTVRRALVVTLALLLSACASTPEQAASTADPLEPFNRGVYQFNDAFDRRIGKPVARGYKAVVPEPVDQGVSNFFSNLNDISVLYNSALQAKPRETLITANRLLINTTFGVFGIFDVAGRLGAPKQDEDLGQTLGYWGVRTGPYLVLPFLGPSTARDGFGRLADIPNRPLQEIDDRSTLIATVALFGIDTRADLLGTTDVLDTAAVDPYIYTRDAYLRRRLNLVYDGNPPAVPMADEADDGFDPFSDEDDDLFENQGAGSAGAD